MPSKRRPQARRGRKPRAERNNSPSSISRAERANKLRSRAKSVPGKISKRYRAPRPSSLSLKQLKTRADVLAAHSDMMLNPKLTASQAASDNGVNVRDFWRYIPKAFTKDSSGRIRAISDRYVRRLEIPGPDGPILIRIRGSKAKGEFARFRNDFFRVLGGDRSALDKWRGVTIQGHKLLTDPRIVRMLGEQDNLPEHFGSEQVIPYSGGAA
jgi:hypothetical protein